MKRLLLKFAYGILNRYKELVLIATLGNVLLVNGERFTMTGWEITKTVGEPSRVTIYGTDSLEVFYGRN